MIQIGWCLANKLAQWLEPHERDAVCGDQVELGATGTQAAREVIGLVVRRQLQLELWKDWRPWLALLGIVIPFGFSLAAETLFLGRNLAPTFAASWSAEFTWAGVLAYPLIVCANAVVLGTLSWASGYVIGSYAGRTLPSNLVLLLFAWLGAFAMWFSQRGIWVPKYPDGATLPTLIASSLVFHVIAFVVPIYFGLRSGSRHGAIPRYRALATAIVPMAPSIVATAYVLCSYPAPGVEWPAVFGYMLRRGWPGALVVLRTVQLRRQRLAR